MLGDIPTVYLVDYRSEDNRREWYRGYRMKDIGFLWWEEDQRLGHSYDKKVEPNNCRSRNGLTKHE